MERATEVGGLCDSHGWIFVMGIEPDRPEDLADIDKLMRKRPLIPRSGFVPRRSRNDYCPCGSGEKYKNCCWDKDHAETPSVA